MMNRVMRASAAVLFAGAAAAGVLFAGTGVASAAPAGLVNDYQQTFYDVPQYGVSSWPLCVAEQNRRNKNTYGNVNGDGTQKFYCAAGSGSSTNLWWRHYA